MRMLRLFAVAAAEAADPSLMSCLRPLGALPMPMSRES